MEPCPWLQFHMNDLGLTDILMGIYTRRGVAWVKAVRMGRLEPDMEEVHTMIRVLQTERHMKETWRQIRISLGR